VAGPKKFCSTWARQQPDAAWRSTPRGLDIGIFDLPAESHSHTLTVFKARKYEYTEGKEVRSSR
jgi:hypothetical protein